MKVKTSQRSFFVFESVAMTDIVMNLFLFFFIAFNLVYTFNPHRESRIEVKLPQGTAAEPLQEEGPVVVSVTAANEIYIGKTRVLPSRLVKELEKKAASTGKKALLVRSDKAASVDYLVKVLDAAKKAGIPKLGVAVQEA